MIDRSIELSIRCQSKLLSIHRSNIYYEAVTPGDETILANEIHSIWCADVCGGYRKITAMLQRRGYTINHKRVLRIMREINIKAIYPKRRTSIPDKKHKKYPYLLRDLVIYKPNQVWSTDITYIKIGGGWMYLVAILDVYSRYVLSWGLSNSLETEFCKEALGRAFCTVTPEILNTDQGVQFTSEEWIKFVLEHNVKVSMDGVGRWADNIYSERFWRTGKYEHIYLHSFDSVKELKQSLAKFVQHYNCSRLHQNLDYNTPYEVYTGKTQAPSVCRASKKKEAALSSDVSGPPIPPTGGCTLEARGFGQSPLELGIVAGAI